VGYAGDADLGNADSPGRAGSADGIENWGCAENSGARSYDTGWNGCDGGSSPGRGCRAWGSDTVDQSPE
jgi:hypothetical protein